VDCTVNLIIGPSLEPKKLALKRDGLINEVRKYTRAVFGSRDLLEVAKVVLLQRWLLSNVSLYFISDNYLGEQPFLLAVTFFTKPDNLYYLSSF